MINNTVKTSKTSSSPSYGFGKVNPFYGAPSIPLNITPQKNPLINSGTNAGISSPQGTSSIFSSGPSSISITKGGTGIGTGGTKGVVNLQSAAKKTPTSSTGQTTKNINPQTTQTATTSPYLNASSSIYQQNPLWLRPGETSSQYSQRIAAQNSSTGTGSGTQGQGVSTPSTFSGLVGQTAQTASQPSAAFTQAQQTAQSALQQLQQSQTNEAGAMAGIGDTAIPLEFQQGRAQVLQSQYQQQQAALAQEYAGAASLETAATGQQQAQISGLGTAAGLAQTQFGQPGQAGYSPLTGTYTAGGTGQITPDNPFYPTMQTYANQLANNQVSALPSSITGNPVLFAQVLNMAQAINPNFNYNAAVGTGAAQQYNVQTGGTAGVTAAQNVFNTSYSTYNQLQNSVQNIDSFGQLLVSGMTNQSGETINPTDIQGLNQTLAQFRSQLSNASQSQFDSTLAALQSKVSGLLSAGGNEIPSQITADAQQIMSSTLPISSLQSVLYRIQQEGNSLLTNQANIVNQNWQRLQSGGTLSTGGTQNATGNTSSNSTYNF